MSAPSPPSAAAPDAAASEHPRLARLDPGDYALDPATLTSVMSPALVVYQQKVEHNISRMLGYLGGDAGRWRVHLKTTKIPEIYALLVDAGLRAFKCATVREATCMLTVLEERAVVDADLLIAYPLQGPALERARALAAHHRAVRIAVLSEDAAHASGVPEPLGIFVDVNPGMNRTGIPLAETERIARVAHAAGARFRGLHAYDGHIHDREAASRRAAAHRIYRKLSQLIEELEAAGIEIPETITSGTPTFRYALDFPGFAGGRLASGRGLHRVSPGTVVFHDFQYDQLLEDLELEPAAVVLARVVSHPRSGLVTCDAGSKSIAAECGDPVAFAIGHPGWVARSPSEEHLPLEIAGEGAPPALGTALYLVPRHVCPTVNLAEQALLVRADGSAHAVAVTARAHDLLLPP